MSYVAASTPSTRRALVSQAGRLPFRGPLRSVDRHENARADHEIDLRQLRHHTRNTLQRILGLIAEAPGLRETPEGEKIARELEYRIGLSAIISNALFGLTDAPGPMADRLRKLSGAVADMMRETDQVIRIGVSVRGCCPAEVRDAVLRSAHELISNAVKHGMKGRTNGRIAVRLVTDEDSTTLTVLDNGWGLSGEPHAGEGLELARGLAARHGGSLVLDGHDGTVATMELPHRVGAFSG